MNYFSQCNELGEQGNLAMKTFSQPQTRNSFDIHSEPSFIIQKTKKQYRLSLLF